MNIMRIMRKSLFLFLLGAGIALFSGGKNKQAVGGVVKQTTLCCAWQGNSLQKLLASFCRFGNNIKHKFVEHFDIVFIFPLGTVHQ